MSAQDFLVCSDKLALVKEMAGKAAEVAASCGGKVYALYAGSEDFTAQDLANAGADVVFDPKGALKAGDSEALAHVLAALKAEIAPLAILIGGTKTGFEVAPRLAERLQSAYAANVIDLSVEDGALSVNCSLYTGLGVEKMEFEPGLVVMTASAGAFSALERSGAAAETRDLPFSAPASRVAISAYNHKPVSTARVEEAKAIVDVGQGVKNKEDLAQFEALASELSGLVTCTRPLAADRDWFPEWLGLSGKKVSPEVCLVVGVSGAVQHIVGVRDSHLIVAVNNDENAGVFLDADYGVIADLYEFIPAFSAQLKARGVRPVWVD
jgi:electron transfer flavoprotein alpha subunit